MIAYIPQRIETVEQAESLPEGSAVVRLDIPWIATKRGPDENGHTWWESKNGIYDHGDVLRDTAFVPVEVEEGTDTIQTGAENFYTRTRYITRWEKASGPSAEYVPGEGDGDGWVITHHSLDGREARE